MTGRARRVLGGLALTLAVLAWAWPGLARAHHVPGHGSSEGVRSINTIGGRGGNAQTRLVLLTEFSHASTGLAPGQQYALSILGEYAPVPEFSIGAQFPLQIVDEQGLPAAVGYGDTRLQVRYTPHARKLIHRVLTLGVNASFPTRTVRSTADPGRTWSVTPNAIFTRTYARWYWQVLALSTVETRPAGTALDVGAAGQVGLRLLGGKLSPGVGLLAETRVATWCEPVGGGAQTFCREGRVTEQQRALGTTRPAAIAVLAWNFTDWGSLWVSAQVPFTRWRDNDVGASLGLQAAF